MICNQLEARVRVFNKGLSQSPLEKDCSSYLKLLTHQRMDSWGQDSEAIAWTTGQLPDHSTGLSHNFQNSF